MPFGVGPSSVTCSRPGWRCSAPVDASAAWAVPSPRTMSVARGRSSWGSGPNSWWTPRIATSKPPPDLSRGDPAEPACRELREGQGRAGAARQALDEVAARMAGDRVVRDRAPGGNPPDLVGDAASEPQG